MDRLTDFARDLASRPFTYGDCDCAMALANWVARARGDDPATALRGRYRTRLGWMRIVKRAGGLVALVDELARAAGLEPTDRPVAGDIGVVTTALGEVGAIKTTRGWMVKVDRGVTVMDFPVLRAWRV